MAMTKKKVPQDTILKVGGKNNYASATVKGKGPTKQQDIKACAKKLCGSKSSKKKS